MLWQFLSVVYHFGIYNSLYFLKKFFSARPPQQPSFRARGGPFLLRQEKKLSSFFSLLFTLFLFVLKGVLIGVPK